MVVVTGVTNYRIKKKKNLGVIWIEAVIIIILLMCLDPLAQLGFLILWTSYYSLFIQFSWRWLGNSVWPLKIDPCFFFVSWILICSLNGWAQLNFTLNFSMQPREMLEPRRSRGQVTDMCCSSCACKLADIQYMTLCVFIILHCSRMEHLWLFFVWSKRTMQFHKLILTNNNSLCWLFISQA